MLARDGADAGSTGVVFRDATLAVGFPAVVTGVGIFFSRGGAFSFLDAAFAVDFLERVPEAFLAFFAIVFFALFFAAFLVFFTARLVFFARFFTAAAFAPRPFCDLRVLLAFCFFEGRFFGVATTNSFDTSNETVRIDSRRRDYRVASASCPNTEKTSGFRSRL